MIANTGENDSYLKRDVKLAPDAIYELSGRIKTQDVKGRIDAGASLDVEGNVSKKWLTGRYVTGTSDWRPFRVEVTTPPLIKPDSRLILELRLGYYGDGTSGRAWFDNIELKRIK